MVKDFKWMTVLLFILFNAASCKDTSTEPPVDEPEPITEPSKVMVATYAALTAPDGITIDKDGNLFATNYGNSQVFKIDTLKNVTSFMTNQPGAAGMTFDENGTMYLARYDSSDVVRVSADGVILDTVATDILGPIAVELDNAGNLYINNNIGPHVSIVDKNGVQSVYATHGLNNNSSLTLDDDGNVYISLYGSGQLLKISSADRTVSNFARLPRGIGFITYSDGFLYATGIRDHKIYRVDLEGKSDVIAGSGIEGHVDGTGDVAQFSTPIGIVASDDGKTLYVAEGGGFIRVITNFRD